MNLRKKLQQHMALNSYVEKVQSGTTSVTLTDAIHNGLKEITAYGKTEQPAKTYLDSVVANGKTEIQRKIDGYTEVETITNTYSTLINTGIAPDVDDMIFEIKVQPSINSWYIFQARESNPIWGISGSSTGNTILAGWNGNQSIMSSALTRNPDHTYFIRLSFKNGNGTLYVKDLTENVDDTQTCTYTFANTTQQPICLFANTQPNYAYPNKLYYAKLYKAGELVLYYMPVIDDENTPGFYDLISKTFKTPSAGSLTAGTNVTTPVADPYNPVDIVCNNGKLKVSPNEFNPNDYELGYYINKDKSGAITSSVWNFVTGYMPVKPNTSYVLYGRQRSNNRLSSYNRIHWYDSNFNYLSTSDYTKNTISVGTSPSNAVYARCSINESGDTIVATTDEIVKSYDWTFREGNTEQSFIPYGLIIDGLTETLVDGENNTATCEYLFRTNSNYFDSHSIINGIITRNCAVKILDGSEDWNTATGHDSAFIGLFLTDKISGASPAPICSHFKPTSSWTDFDKPEVMSMILTNSNRNCVIKMVGIDTIDDFKTYLRNQYLNGTPVMVVYTLAEPVTETVNKQFLRKSPVEITQASLENLEVVTTESAHTTPSPDYPLDIVCNNGILKSDNHGSATVEGTPETIVLHSKNLFDQANATLYKTAWTNTGSGNWQIISDSSYAVCYGSYVKPDTTYTLSKCGGSRLIVTGFKTKTEPSYDTITPADYQIKVDTTEIGDGYYTFTTPSDCVWILFGLRQNNANFEFPYNVQLEESYRPTKYEAYGSSVVYPQDLLKTEDYVDEQSIIDGAITRNVGVKVLDGTENGWGKTNNSFGNTALFADKKTEKSTLFCSHFQYDIGSTSTIPDVCIGCASTSTNTYFRYDALSTVENWKQWLADQYAAGTPVIVVYPLATSVTENVNPQQIELTSGNSIIERSSEYVTNLNLDVDYLKLP